MGGTRFMVQWEEHPSHLATRLGQLLEHQTLVDVTLMCNTHTLRVHRAVLAACSPYFETILQRQLGMHPLIVLKDMQFCVLKSLIEFMYCGETSVTEDNLGALLQAARFFQVKGLSAMTKEALGLVPNSKSAVNGDAGRKAFVGRPKRVAMQQTLVTSSLRAVGTQSSGSHGTTAGSDAATLPTKATFQTISKSVAARPDTQQQTDTAQLLLSLSGSDFPKQTFHTVSKNVRYQHTVSGNAVAIESGRSAALDGNTKTKEVAGRIPVMNSNGGVKASSSVSQSNNQVVEQSASGASREDVLVANAQSVYVAEGFRRRGRPVKRQMNVLFQEKMMTDADVALHKEAEASRKALEMLRQEMSADGLESNVSTSSAVAGTVAASSIASTPLPLSTSVSNVSNITNMNENVQKGLVKQNTLGGSKLQVQSMQAPFITTSRTIVASQTASAVATKRNSNVVYKAVNTVTTTVNSKKVIQAASSMTASSDTTGSGVNVTFKMDETEIPQQVFHLAEESAQDPLKEDSVEFQVNEPTENETDLATANQNIVYQVADANNAPTGSVVTHYMDALKEAGIPTDVPILLDSGDGSYVTVNEEVLMNIVNGGVLQCHVTEGNLVGNDGVEFIVHEITEDEMEAVQAQVQEQTLNQVEETDKNMDIKQAEDSLAAQTNLLEDTTNAMEIVGDTIGSSNTEEVPTNSMEASSNLEANTFEAPTCLEDNGNGIVKSESISELDMSTDSVELPTEDGNKDVINVDAAKEQTLIDTLKTGDPVSMEGVSEEVEKSAESGNPPSLASVFTEDVAKVQVLADQPGVNSAPIKLGNFTTPEEDSSMFRNDQDGPDICQEHFTGVEINPEQPKMEKSNNDEMSVEQALQAMMGEGSDTEMDTCSNNNTRTVPDENVSEMETTQPLNDPKSPEDLHFVLRSEDGSDDLRLVLGPVEDIVKDSRCNEESSSLTLVLSSENTNSSELDSKPNMEKEDSITNLETTTTTASENLNVIMMQENNSDTATSQNEYENVNMSVSEHVNDNLQVKSDQEIFLDSQPVPVAEDNETSKVILHQGGSNEFAEGVPGESIRDENEENLHLAPSTSTTSVEAACDATKHPKPKGKESTADMPATRAKRKASTSDGPDKKLKVSSIEADITVGQQFAEEESSGAGTMAFAASNTFPEGEKDETLLSMSD